ncbi:pentatricopeptide repeat-containing protein [Tanacetum coccineum]
MYIKCSNINYAHKVFDKMPQRDTVSYNALVFGYAGIGNMAMAQMIFDDIPVRDVVSWNSLLLGYLQNVHGLIVRMGFLNDVVAGSATVDIALIAGCVHNNEYLDGLKLFKDMQREEGLHGHSLKMNFGSDIIVGTATLDMYAKCGRLCDAKKLFHRLSIHNLQSYNAIIIGCARVDQGLEALHLFHNLMITNLGFDHITLSGVFSACAAIKSYTVGVQLHGLTIKSMLQSNVCVENAILDMYGNCGALAEARSVFEEMQIRDAVSWNAIIAAYEQNGIVDESLHLLVWMLSSGLEPDEFTFGSVLKACAGLQSLNYGMEVHGRIIKSGMGLESFVGSALVDMYCKCSKVEDAEKLHERMEEQWCHGMQLSQGSRCKSKVKKLKSSFLKSSLRNSS